MPAEFSIWVNGWRKFSVPEQAGSKLWLQAVSVHLPRKCLNRIFRKKSLPLSSAMHMRIIKRFWCTPGAE
ncbi:hypothetical protein D3C73_1338570 [compost metagenome]